jgi:hypothetical protein
MPETFTRLGDNQDTANVATIAVTLSRAIAADKPCVAWHFAHATAPPDSCTASGGGVTWTKRATDQRGNIRVTLFTSDGVASPSGTTITFDNGTGAGIANDAWVYEISGGDPADWQYAANNLNAATSVAATVGATPDADALGMVAAAYLESDGAISWTAGFTQDDSGTHATPNCDTSVATDSGSPPATVTATYSGTAANTVIAYVSIEPAAAPPTPPAGTGSTDDFLRNITNGFGTASGAGDYDLSGTASQFSVTNGIGYIKKTVSGIAAVGLYPGQSESGFSPPNPDGGIDILDLDVQFAFKLPTLAVGKTTDFEITCRLRCQEDTDQNGVSPNPTDDFYFVRIVVDKDASNDFRYEIAKLIANSETNIDAGGSLAMAPAADEWWVLRCQAMDTSPTTIRFKLWQYDDPEPGTWTDSVTDSQAGLQNSGGWGTRFIATEGEGAELHLAGLSISTISEGVPVILLGGL